jgi:hypothetical protein
VKRFGIWAPISLLHCSKNNPDVVGILQRTLAKGSARNAFSWSAAAAFGTLFGTFSKEGLAGGQLALRRINPKGEE